MSDPITQGVLDEPSGFMKQPNNITLASGATRLIDNAREFAEGGDRYTGPEVRVWIYKLCDEIERLYDADASLTKAYAEGREDQRADDVKAIGALASKMRLGLA